MLRLDAVVPGEEGQAELRMPAVLDREQAVLQLLPEAGGRPVLDGEAGALGKLRIIAAVGPAASSFRHELQERRGSAVTALAEVVEGEAEAPRPP